MGIPPIHIATRYQLSFHIYICQEKNEFFSSLGEISKIFSANSKGAAEATPFFQVITLHIRYPSLLFSTHTLVD